jgi:hypothetical protein
LILTSDLTLEAVLGGAVSANQPEFHVDYIVRDNSANPVPKPATLRGALNSTTDVTLISPTTGRYSTQGFVAEVQRLSIYNKDTASVTVTVKTTDGSTDRIKCKVTLETGEFLSYANGLWQAFTSDGSLKTNAISYAEFTWTPVLDFQTTGDLAVAYSVQLGIGTFTGREVTIYYNIVTSAFTHTTAAGACLIKGIPYSAVATAGQLYVGQMLWAGVTKANYTQVMPRINSVSASQIDLVAAGSGQGASSVTATDMPTGGTLNFRGSISFPM